jgi:hypothetical protein
VSGHITVTGLFSGQDPTHNSDFSLSSFEVAPVASMPEPARCLLVGTGLAAAFRARRRQRARGDEPTA